MNKITRGRNYGLCGDPT